MTQTKLDLNAIQARADAASDGPWEVWYKGTYENLVVCHAGDGDSIMDEATAAFIAAARTDVPALVARVRELEAINNTLASAAASAGSRVEELETAVYNHHYNKDISNVTRGGDRHDRMLWEILNLKHS